jgi:hypothetical protein
MKQLLGKFPSCLFGWLLWVSLFCDVVNLRCFFFPRLLHNFLGLVQSYQKNVECDDDGQFYSTS